MKSRCNTRNNSVLLLCGVLIVLFHGLPAFPQTDVLPTLNAGRPFIQNFSPKEYGAHNQNWAIVQDQRGVMYFGNESGVLEYDGNSWRLIPVANRSVIRSLAVDSTGRIYVGAQREFGYLAPDSIGQLQYVSLSERLDKTDRNFADVWETFVTSKGIYFRTNHYIYYWSDNRFKTWKAQNRFHTSFLVRDSLYVRQWGVGLMRLEGGSLRLLPGGEQFANKRTYVMLPFDGQRLLIGTRAKGLFLFNGRGFQPFNTDPAVSLFLQKHLLYHGANLPDGTIALASSLSGGVAIINRQGKLLQMLNKSAGLRHGGVNFVYQGNGEIWLALDNGLAKAEIASPLTIFKNNIEKNAIIYSMLRYRGVLYLATGSGIQYYNPRQKAFRVIPGTNTQCWQLLIANDKLLAATSDGVFRIHNRRASFVRKSLTRDYNAHSLYHSRQDSNLVFVGINGGLSLLRFTNGRWVDKGNIAGITEKILSIVETDGGGLWLGTQSEGVLRVTFPIPVKFLFDSQVMPENQPIIQRFGTGEGLPNGAVVISIVAGKIYFATSAGLLRFRENAASPAQGKHFIPDSTFAGISAGEYSEDYVITEDPQGKVWINWGRESAVAVPRPNGSFRLDRTPFLRFADLDVNTIYPEAGGVTWFGGSDGLIRYDANIKKNYEMDYPVLIRRVIANGDSTVYGGASPFQGGKNNNSSFEGELREMSPTLKYAANSLRFEYAAISYEDPARNRYQVFLEGFDKEWSPWTAETRKDYTNLSEGNYRFHVRARNVFEHPGREAMFEFTILPPWYRSWLAYAVYGLLFAVTLYFIRRIELGRTQRRHQRELQLLAYEKLKELDHLKSRFFANISHEFRTPLTLILGQIDSALPEISAKGVKNKLRMAFRNGKQLLRLINQLLDVSKLEAGGMKLKTTSVNIVPFIKSLTYSFESAAELKGVNLRFTANSGTAGDGKIIAYLDREKVEKVMYNLLSNALKFTPGGGMVEVAVGINNNPSQPPLDKGRSQEFPLLTTRGVKEGVEYVEIRISDTGVGIPADQLEYIFDRFYQVDSSSTRPHEGSGIGLALTKELVTLHHGEITVKSVEGKGTSFQVRLPLGKKHLAPEEICSRAIPPFIETGAASDNHVSEILSTKKKHAEASSGHQKPIIVRQPGDNGHPEAVDSEIILIVEDNADVRTYTRQHLEAQYRVMEAADGMEGIAKAREAIPDLIITDVMMPKMNGYEFSKNIRADEKTSHIPIIMLTARAGEEDKLTGLEIGVDDYLIKPFNSRELKVRVKNLIDLRKRLRQRFSTATIFKPSDVTATPTDQSFLQRVMETIERHIGDESFDIKKLSREVGMSNTHLHRKLRALIDQTPGQLIRSLRLQRAADLLKQNAGNISEIAYAVGFYDHAHFSRQFKKQFGCPPTNYKRDKG